MKLTGIFIHEPLVFRVPQKSPQSTHHFDHIGEQASAVRSPARERQPVAVASYPEFAFSSALAKSSGPR